MGIAFENNEYAPISEFTFHAKLYEITGNATIREFQEIIHPVMVFVKDKFKELLEPINIEIKERGELVTHADLLGFWKNMMRPVIERRLRNILPYTRFL